MNEIYYGSLQKMNTELGKVSDEDELPTMEWTNKKLSTKMIKKLDGIIYYNRIYETRLVCTNQK